MFMFTSVIGVGESAIVYKILKIGIAYVCKLKKLRHSETIF